MRKNLYDILQDMKLNVPREYSTLYDLFVVESSVYTGRHFSLADVIDANYFRSMSIRETFTSVKAMMKALDLRETASDIDKLFLFCEFLLSLLMSKELKNVTAADFNTQSDTIIRNILRIVDKCNHELKNLSEDKDEYKIIIVEKNKSATLAAEIVDDTAVSIDLITYNHYALKGNLAEKKKILTAIGSYIEPILKSPALDKAGYKQLESDTGFVLNCFHIRHNNKTGAKEQEYIKTLSDVELEKWYDRAYDMMIAVILINEHIPAQEEIKELKVKYTWRM